MNGIGLIEIVRGPARLSAWGDYRGFHLEGGYNCRMGAVSILIPQRECGRWIEFFQRANHEGRAELGEFELTGLEVGDKFVLKSRSGWLLEIRVGEIINVVRAMNLWRGAIDPLKQR